VTGQVSVFVGDPERNVIELRGRDQDIAPTYNNMVATDRPALIPVLTTHMLGEVTAIARALPNDASRCNGTCARRSLLGRRHVRRRRGTAGEAKMGRPSFIRPAVTMKHRQLVSAAISGEAILVAEGAIGWLSSESRRSHPTIVVKR
jgi:hypothetical protein